MSMPKRDKLRRKLESQQFGKYGQMECVKCMQRLQLHDVNWHFAICPNETYKTF